MNQTFPLFFGLVTTPLECWSFVLSLITVYLNIRQIHWAWLFAILSSGLYAFVFFDAKLYGDMGLQGLFILVSVWGWMLWWRGSARPQAAVTESESAFVVTRLQRSQQFFSLLAWLLGFFVFAWFLKTQTDTDVPFADGFLTAGSVLGQVLLSKKKIENWLVWIVVDVLYVALYIHKDLMLTAFLYAVFVVMAALGWRVWSKTCQR